MTTKKIELEGFENQQIEVKSAGLFSGMKLLVNEQPAEKGPKRGQMLLRRDDGTEAIAMWKPVMMGLDLPQLDVDGQLVEITKPVKWYEIAWSALPILLLFVGGFFGALLGGIAFMINGKIFHSKMNTAIKFLLTAGVSVASGIVWVILVMLITTLVG